VKLPRLCSADAVLAIGLLFCPLQLAGVESDAKSASGYKYYREEIPEEPWSIQILKIERGNKLLQFHTTLGNGNSIALVTLPDQLRTLPEDLGKPIAAINGDYYQNRDPYKGDPKGVQIVNGELVSAPCGWTCLWIDEHGEPHMAQVESKFSVTWPGGEVSGMGLNEPRAPGQCVLYTDAVGTSTRTKGGTELVLETASSSKRLPLEIGEEYSVVVREIRPGGNSPVATNAMVLSVGPQAFRGISKIKKGSLLRISTATNPSMKGSRTAISGGPALLRDRKVQVGWSAIRHPRTAVGWNKNHIYWVQVDGRQAGHSVGMTYSELAAYMEKLGCEQALNLDGGGSSTFWVLGQVMNSPSLGRPRGIANGLVLIQKNAEPAATSDAEVDK
jgi:hypothetical protein